VSTTRRRVELSCVGVTIDTLPTQLNSTSSGVELCRYKRAFSFVRFSFTYVSSFR